MKLLTLLLILIATPSAANELIADINSSCTQKWPADYTMQKHCRMRQGEALVWLSKFMKAHPAGVEYEIVTTCLAKWHQNPGFDYVMSKHCTKRQLEAYKGL